MDRRFGHHFDPVTETLPLIGSKEGLAHLPYAVVNPGDVVVYPEPGYQAYIGGAILCGAESHVYPLRAEEGYLLELERVPEAVLRRTRLVYVNYPNNPTTAVVEDVKFFEEVVRFAKKYDILVVHDNPYCDIVFDDYVAPSFLLSRFNDSVNSNGKLIDSRPPLVVCKGGRGLSVGSSSTGGLPANCPRQNSSCFAYTSPRNHSRCHTA